MRKTLPCVAGLDLDNRVLGLLKARVVGDSTALTVCELLLGDAKMSVDRIVAKLYPAGGGEELRELMARGPSGSCPTTPDLNFWACVLGNWVA